MKTIFKIAIANLAGLFAGWTLQQYYSAQNISEAHPNSKIKTEMPSPEYAGWQMWLETSAPLSVVPDASAFWRHIPTAKFQTRTEIELAMDEAFFSLPVEEFLSVLRDTEFARFPGLLDPEESSTWSRKLMGLGLDLAVRMSGRMPAKALNMHLESCLIEAFARQDPARGFEWIKELPTYDVCKYLAEVAKSNPEQVDNLFQKLDSPDERSIGSSLILETLGISDWRKAEAWGKINLSPDEWSSAAKDIFNGYGGKRLMELKTIGDQTKDPALRSAAYSRSVIWPPVGSREIFERVEALPPGTLNSDGWHEVSISCCLAEIGAQDPAASASNIRSLALRVPEQHRARFLEAAVKMFCANGSSVADQFFDIISSENVDLLAKTKTKLNPEEAAKWLNTLPASDKREAAVVAFCREATAVDPAGAAAWALTIQEPVQRETALTRALAGWRQADPAAAAAWAESKGLVAPGER